MSATRIDVFGPAWHRQTQSWRIYAHEHGPGPCRQIRYLWSQPFATEEEAAEVMKAIGLGKAGGLCVFTDRP